MMKDEGKSSQVFFLMYLFIKGSCSFVCSFVSILHRPALSWGYPCCWADKSYLVMCMGILPILLNLIKYVP